MKDVWIPSMPPKRPSYGADGSCGNDRLLSSHSTLASSEMVEVSRKRYSQQRCYYTKRASLGLHGTKTVQLCSGSILFNVASESNRRQATYTLSFPRTTKMGAGPRPRRCVLSISKRVRKISNAQVGCGVGAGLGVVIQQDGDEIIKAGATCRERHDIRNRRRSWCGVSSRAFKRLVKKIDRVYPAILIAW